MIVYKILNTINNKVYIGQSVNGGSRWTEHKSELNRGVHGNEHLQSAWNKYGESAFVFEVVKECLSREDLNLEERRLITEFNSLDRRHGYNLRAGGNDYTHSDETRQKMSRLKTGFRHSEETKKKISQNSSKNMLGRSHSEQTRKKISIAGIGRLKSPETLAKLKATLATSTNPHHIKGVPKPETQRQRAIDGMKKKWEDPEFREKMILARKKQATPERSAKSVATRKQNGNSSNHAKNWPDLIDANGTIHTNIHDMNKFSKLHDLNAGVLRQVAHGKKKSYKGWKLAPRESL